MHVSFAAEYVNDKNIPDAMVSIIFDYKGYTAKLTEEQYNIIDRFFDSMAWD